MATVSIGCLSHGGMRSKPVSRKAFVIAITLLMAGCATVEGIGEDISGSARRVSGWF